MPVDKLQLTPHWYTVGYSGNANLIGFCQARDILGGNVVHVGGPGMGHVVKVINQVIVGLNIEAVAEGLTLAEKSGVDPQLVQQALSFIFYQRIMRDIVLIPLTLFQLIVGILLFIHCISTMEVYSNTSQLKMD